MFNKAILGWVKNLEYVNLGKIYIEKPVIYEVFNYFTYKIKKICNVAKIYHYYFLLYLQFFIFYKIHILA